MDFLYVTLPYADDFCLLTTHMRTHQNLVRDIKTKVESMGMRLVQEPQYFQGQGRRYPFCYWQLQEPQHLRRGAEVPGQDPLLLWQVRRSLQPHS